MVGVTATGPLQPVADALAEALRPRSTTSSSRPASTTCLVEVVCESDDHLLDLISNKIRAMPGVLATETFMYLRLAKQTYSWGVR